MKDLNCFLYSDLNESEKLSIHSLVAEMGKRYDVEAVEVRAEHAGCLRSLPRSKVSWIVARNWVEASHFLKYRPQKKKTFFSVLGFPSRTGLLSLFWNANKKIIPRGAELITHSPMNERFFREMGSGEEAVVRFLPLPYPAFEVPKSKTTHPEITVGTWAEFIPQNNLHYLFNIAHCVSYAFPECKFKIMGAGKLSHHLHQLVDELHLGGKVTVEDHVPLSAIGEVDIFLYFPLQNAHFLSVLAAGSRGLALVADEIAGIDSLITSDKTGYIASVHQTKEVSAEIISLLADRKKRKKWSLDTKKYFQEHFNPAVLAPLYERVLLSEVLPRVRQAA